MTPPNAHALWLLRHAQPHIAPGICYGRLDVAADAALTAKAAKNFSAACPTAAALRHSPLQRCEQLTQELIALRPDLAYSTSPDPALQEMDFGDWEGQPWDAIARSQIDAWTQDLAGYAPGSGETLTAMLQRVHAALQQSWHIDSLGGERDVVWATHAGVIRCVQWLQRHGTAQPTSAQWVLPAPGFGQWLALPWQSLQGMAAQVSK